MNHDLNTLRERATTFGPASLADQETLTLLLSRTMADGAATCATVLLKRFGSLQEVLAAEQAQLEKHVDRPAAIDLKIVHDATRRALEAPIRKRSVISSWDALLAYVRHDMAYRTREAFRVLFLDKKNQLIADEVMNEGTVDHTPVYPREVVRRALELDACAVILVHNHPSGDTTPSTADVDMTRQVIDACKPLRIAVHDHLVVGSGGVASFKALGLI